MIDQAAARECGKFASTDASAFKLELPRETTYAVAYQAGLDYIENTLKLKQHADYSCSRSKPHPTMPLTSVFSYSYKAYPWRSGKCLHTRRDVFGRKVLSINYFRLKSS